MIEVATIRGAKLIESGVRLVVLEKESGEQRSAWMQLGRVGRR